MHKSLLSLTLFTVFSMAGGDIAPVEPQIDISLGNEAVVDNDVFYVGAGYTRVHYDEKTTDHSDKGFNLQVGYDYNPYIGVVARYTNTTNSNDENYDFEGDLENIALYLKPMLPVTMDVSLYALLGYGQTSIDTQIGEKSESGFQWGLGAQYTLMQNINLFADYTQFYEGNGFDRDPSSDDVRLYSINVGLNYIY